jgi:ectoine hydroxylase-related dioxygenase (phytanoyl-CoA dioxygenase family)
MKKGDIVFFHPLLVHGSGENKTTGYRKVHYVFIFSQCVAILQLLNANMSQYKAKFKN